MRSGVQTRRIEVALLVVGAFLLMKSGYAVSKYALFEAHPDWFRADGIQPNWLKSQPARTEMRDLSQLPEPAAPPSLRILGKIEIPRLTRSVVVVDGDDEESLSVAAGHVPGTAPLNGQGNCVLAGHRDTVFRALRDVRLGENIYVRSDRVYLYVVKSMNVVSPDDLSVLKASSKGLLTLITCFPFSYAGNAPQRYIVQAELAQITR